MLSLPIKLQTSTSVRMIPRFVNMAAAVTIVMVAIIVNASPLATPERTVRQVRERFDKMNCGR